MPPHFGLVEARGQHQVLHGHRAALEQHLQQASPLLFDEVPAQSDRCPDRERRGREGEEKHEWPEEHPHRLGRGGRASLDGTLAHGEGSATAHSADDQEQSSGSEQRGPGAGAAGKEGSHHQQERRRSRAEQAEHAEGAPHLGAGVGAFGQVQGHAGEAQPRQHRADRDHRHHHRPGPRQQGGHHPGRGHPWRAPLEAPAPHCLA